MSLKCRSFAAAVLGARCAFLVACIFFVGVDVSFAQSRRGIKTKNSARAEISRRAELSNKEAYSPPDKHYFFGRVIGLVDSKHSLVKVSSLLKVGGMVPTYYACDETMTPTAILVPTGIFHKMCAVFETVEGSVIKSDCVMVKYSAK